ncbi:hypothetical protein LVJ94_44545 [Pendulispora rubella]|uniref:Pectate lyase n=1 Tax=Pendulispora rubella TaxID=2741070 RepID=A0ABZ2KZ65_9BACT
MRNIFHHGDDISIKDSIVRDCAGHGILGADEDSGSLTLDHVEVYGCGNGTTKHPIYIATDEVAYPGSVFRMQFCYVHDGKGGNNVKSRAERNEIYYNWIEGAAYREIELIGPEGADPALKREDSDVVGNVFVKSAAGSNVARVGGDGTGDTSGRYRFVNNTFVLAANSPTAIQVFDRIESVEFHNNVFYRIGGGSVPVFRTTEAQWVNGESITGSNNWLPAGSSVPTFTNTKTGADPGFANSGQRDFRLATSSALVGQALLPTASPTAHPFPSPLAAPVFSPPLHAVDPADKATARAKASKVAIGAYENGAQSSTPVSVGSSTGTPGTGSSPGGGAAGDPSSAGENVCP